jgi:protein TonB
MTMLIRAPLSSLLMLAGLVGLAGLTGCSRPRPDAASSVSTSAPAEPAPAAVDTAPPDKPSSAALPPAPSGIDGYKMQVARHVAAHDPERIHMGTLPPLLPAIVVLRITIDRNGRLDHVAMQRSRSSQATAIALTALRRSAPLPPPPQQLVRAHGKVTFSETFLFADADHYQLRSLAGPQAGE